MHHSTHPVAQHVPVGQQKCLALLFLRYAANGIERHPLAGCAILLTVLLTGSYKSHIDRPKDQGYNDPGPTGETDEVDVMIDEIVIEGVWTHAATSEALSWTVGTSSKTRR